MVRPLEERFRTVRDLLPDYRVETTQGRIVVNETGSWQHNTILSQLLFQIAGPVAGRGWEIWPNITVYLGQYADRYVPDLAVVPRSPRMWEEYAVHGDSTLLVVDVVTVGSTYDDYFVKPCGYAPGGVPLYLVIDPFQHRVRLYSEPGGGGYAKQTDVAEGEPLALPEPWGMSIDTANLLSAV
ncbi:Uma2 family endonuclease [Nonomuraea sp. K274]|uniref:Uma2 family endonuclease n=1 Tax=Nonomuraea cypriaca TaxID=1187855 RepID=A0A931AF28_9ACTN|nr:Uma2 family endonuclease [Nonomuraea cypriaca]MBF8190768.1 Uma2 family endonuclease [Nonomuraea cypriaca]